MTPLTIEPQQLKAALADPCSIPGVKKLNRWGLSLKMSHSTAFEKNTVWYLLSDSRPASGRRALSRRFTFWQVSEGDEKEDRIEYVVDDAPLAPEELDKMMLTLNDVPLIPFLENRHWGLDGESFSVETNGYGFNYQWWCEGPKENKGFIDAITHIRSWADRKHETK